MDNWVSHLSLSNGIIVCLKSIVWNWIIESPSFKSRGEECHELSDVPIITDSRLQHSWVWLLVQIPSLRVSSIWTLGSNTDLGCLVLSYDPYVQPIELALVIGYSSKARDWDIFYTFTYSHMAGIHRYQYWHDIDIRHSVEDGCYKIMNRAHNYSKPSTRIIKLR